MNSAQPEIDSALYANQNVALWYVLFSGESLQAVMRRICEAVEDARQTGKPEDWKKAADVAERAHFPKSAIAIRARAGIALPPPRKSSEGWRVYRGGLD